jgi:uncharacterized coiled-coil protein SlyX
MARIIFIICCFTVLTGCATGKPVGQLDYIRPESIAAANYAVEERIRTLEQQIADARSTVSELRKHGDAIRELSGRSTESVQGIIDKMEALVLWIDWATGRIQYLETILQDKTQG